MKDSKNMKETIGNIFAIVLLLGVTWLFILAIYAFTMWVFRVVS